MAIVRPGAAPAHAIIEPLTGMTLVALPGGRFMMGSPADEPGRADDETPHRVTVSAFYLGRTEVTQAQWTTVMGWNPSRHADCAACPVERINFFEIQQFLDRLNAVAHGIHYRLPTEAEWEYACRAGTTTPFSTGRTLTTDQANFNGDFPYNGAPRGLKRGETLPVASFAPNAWGLYDMHGNVWEWTGDWYGPYPGGPAVDPAGPATGTLRAIRGGSWAFDANSARCALRYTHAPILRGYSLGFRVAATAKGSQ